MKKSFYYAGMDACLTVIVNEINRLRKWANDYRTNSEFKDRITGEPMEWAKGAAYNADALADCMEEIMHSKFGV